MDHVINLDHNATTPVDPRVRDALLPHLGVHFGNPSSSHPQRCRRPRCEPCGDRCSDWVPLRLGTGST